MTLYSGITCGASHSCRFVLYEKDVECFVEYIDPREGSEELAQLNPYNETPTLVDRDLVLYTPHIINEYLDERLPHPPLMPVDPVSRGRARLMITRLQRDWFSQLSAIASGDRRSANKARKIVRDGLISISPVFATQKHMLSDEFTLVDCFLLPLLWRLPVFKIELPEQATPLLEYAERMFERPSFQASLSEAEREMRS
ncbi:MAG: glutathione S-transferase N-terminal domain-containing protein [Gammaproteobacteria bacterium]|nr:glutathione S-transferase N-terminal domain-containing protein [Gammaproteobacteria bacterium]